MRVKLFSQYFCSEGCLNGTERRGVELNLISDSEAGMITYSAQAVFFPHTDDEDWAVTYDAEKTDIIYSGKGRRNKKKEAAYLEKRIEIFNKIAQDLNMKILWEKPLTEPRFA